MTNATSKCVADTSYGRAMVLIQVLGKSILALAEAGEAVSTESKDLRKQIAENIGTHAVDIAAFAALAADDA